MTAHDGFRCGCSTTRRHSAIAKLKNKKKGKWPVCRKGFAGSPYENMTCYSYVPGKFKNRNHWLQIRNASVYGGSRPDDLFYTAQRWRSP